MEAMKSLPGFAELDTNMQNQFGKIAKALKKYLITGVLVWLPIVVTLWVISYIINLSDGLVAMLPAQWQPKVLVGHDVPGFGLIIAVLVLFFTGVFGGNVIGRKIIQAWDGMMGRIPSAFVQELRNAKEAPIHGFDDGAVFEGCMPVEVMARRGEDTLRYGPLKPVGLRDPRTGRDNYAVVQLRRDNAEGTLYNIVGFQTHLTFGEQKRVFSMIPALRNAEFVRYGVMHRNTYLNSPQLLDRYYRLRRDPRIRFAGQMTGVEGYVESCASGALVGIETAAQLLGLPPVDFPQETAIGALSLYISGGSVGDFQPMNINFGIITPLDHRVRGKRNKNAEISARSLQILDGLKQKEVFHL